MLIRFKYLIFLLLFAPTLFSQVIDNPDNYANLPKQYYFLNPLIYYAKDNESARLVLYIEILTDVLQFKKNQSNQKFEANYEYSINIRNQSDSVVINETNKEVISRTDEEAKTQNGQSDYKIKYYLLNPGEYKLNFALRDRNNYAEYKSETTIYVPDFIAKNLSISSIMLLSDYKVENGKKSITPLVSNNIGELNGMTIFFEIYNYGMGAIPIALNYKVYNEKNIIVKEGAFSYILAKGINQKIEVIPSADFSIGNFILELSCKTYPELTVQQPFEYKWNQIPISLSDIDKVIDQMIYIATSEDLDYIKAAPSKGEKEKRFLKWWKDHDPSPKTARNELMLEYYTRIKTANERYKTTYSDGWKSDMGMVYIIYGEPSNIDRHPFEGDSKPYEVWEYYDMNRQFIFVDFTGFGDYRLTTPIYDKWFKMR